MMPVISYQLMQKIQRFEQFPLTLEKTDASFRYISLSMIWSALLLTLASLVVIFLFLLLTIRALKRQGQLSRFSTILPNLTMIFGMMLMGLQWTINYLVLIFTDKMHCYGCYFGQFYVYSFGLTIFLIGWLVHVQHYLIKPQGNVRHPKLNGFLYLSIFALSAIVISYFAFPSLRPSFISLSSGITSFVIFSFNVIVLIIATSDLRHAPRSIAIRRLRLKALIFQALIFFIMFLVGLIYAILLTAKAHFYLNVYAVLVLPILSNRGLIFAIIFNLLIYWTVFPHDAFIIQEGFHATKLPFFLDHPRKLIVTQNGFSLLSPTVNEKVGFTPSRPPDTFPGKLSQSRDEKIYLWISDVLTPWAIQWQEMNAKAPQLASNGAKIYFLPLMLSGSSHAEMDLNSKRNDKNDVNSSSDRVLKSTQDYSILLTPENWYQELFLTLRNVLIEIKSTCKENEPLSIIVSGFMTIPLIITIQLLLDENSDLLTNLESLQLISPATPSVIRRIHCKLFSWGRRYRPRGFIYHDFITMMTNDSACKSTLLSHLETIGKKCLLSFFQDLNDLCNWFPPLGMEQSNEIFTIRRKVTSIIMGQACPFLKDHRRDLLTYFSNQTIVFLQGGHLFLDNGSTLLEQVIPHDRNIFRKNVTIDLVKA